MIKETHESVRHYQIGTVSSLTSIDAHTIRAWERRYGAVKPTRSETGRRQYDDEAIERLQLLKALVDCSESIGKIAHLSADALRLRLEKLAEHEGQIQLDPTAAADSDFETKGHRPRIGFFAPALAIQVEANSGALSDFEVVFSESTPGALLEAARSHPCDIVLLELEALDREASETIQACRNLPNTPEVAVLYHFASRATLARVARAGGTLVRSPIRLDALRQTVLDQMRIRRVRARHTPDRRRKIEPAPRTAASPPRRFDDDQLARLFEISTEIDCECPNHLSSLVSALVAFEDYSRECESRDATDAAQHRRLAEGAANARVTMEDLLAQLCAHEGIVV